MAQLREGSVIKKPTGDEAIATVNDMPSKVSELENDSGYVTNADLEDKTELFKITIGLTQPTSGWWYKEII